MPRGVSLLAFAGWLALVASAPADVVWSGDMYQRTYHDISSIDLNQDGTDDFTFNPIISNGYDEIWIEPVDGQVVVDTLYGLIDPIGAPLGEGTLIAANLNNPDITWENAETILYSYGTVMGNPNYGGFFVGVDRYLGISFNVEGSSHHGWVRMSNDAYNTSNPNHEYLMIHGWAWETEANTSIIAGAIPEPSSGILTMIGTLSLLQLARSRRRRKQGHTHMISRRIPKTSTTPEKW